MRSRAALLPHCADPFLFKYWLKTFQIWRDEIDVLYVLVNSPIEQPVIEYMRTLIENDPKIKFMYVPYQIEHGIAINEMLEECKEAYVMLVEDDGFIFKPGAVDASFKLIESGEYDIVGSPRGSCSIEIWDMAKEVWGLNYEGYGDVGPNFWPNFFFIAKQHLIETDRNFAARAWKQGEVIEPLQRAVKEEIANGDTFVNTSLQLRAKGLKIKTIPQYHGSPDDLEDAQRGKNIFDGIAPWVHVGSLSSGTHGVLQDAHGRSLARRLLDPEKESTVLGAHCNSEGERHEWERRVQWWEMFYDNGQDIPLDEFKGLYRQAINQIISQYGLSPTAIEKRRRAYAQLGL